MADRARRRRRRAAANRSRAVRATVIKPRWLWCMCCLRTSVKNFKPGEMEVQEVFEINCVLDGEESILCRQCCGRRGGCEATPAGALGNAAELVELLDWYRACFFHNAEDEEENAFVNFNEDAIRAANNCVVHLGRAFVQMVATHNRYHGLSVAQKSRRTANYEAFLARRRKIVGVDIEKLCLMPGDPGFVLWTSAKQSFHDGISAAVGLQFDGDRLDEILEWMFEEFPVALGEL